MPPPSRRPWLRRSDDYALAAAWAGAFATGRDVNGALAELGLTEIDVAAEMGSAWSRYGRAFLDRGLGEAWPGRTHALTLFGEP